MIMQQKNRQTIRFEITGQTMDAIERWMHKAQLGSDQYLFPSRKDLTKHIIARQYKRIVKSWVTLIGLEPGEYATHSLRRTKATLIYHRTSNLHADQLLVGHTKIESTVRYLGIEVDDALDMAE